MTRHAGRTSLSGVAGTWRTSRFREPAWTTNSHPVVWATASSTTSIPSSPRAARFVFWYASPRIFIDLLRDYPTHRLALGTGQTLNIVMMIVGVVLLARLQERERLVGRASRETASRPVVDLGPPLWQPFALASLLAFCLTIPSNWTQDVPARYGTRHPGLVYSRIYPPIDTSVR